MCRLRFVGRYNEVNGVFCKMSAHEEECVRFECKDESDFAVTNHFSVCLLVFNTFGKCCFI